MSNGAHGARLIICDVEWFSQPLLNGAHGYNTTLGNMELIFAICMSEVSNLANSL